MDLLKGELGSSSEICVISALNGNDVTGMEAERVSNMKEEEVEDPATVSAIKMEPNVSVLSVVSVTHISHRLYPEWPARVSMC
jgi:hypothetical protein